MTSLARRALGGSTILLIAVMLVNVLNYGYALVLGRTLGPAAYGAYASFVALFLILSLWPLTLQQVAARFSATESSVQGILRPLAWKSGIVLGLLLLLLSVPLSKLLQLPASWLMGLALLLPLFGLTGVLRGEAQGESRFLPFGANLVIEHLGKIALTPLTLLLAPGASGAVLATLAAFPLTVLHLRHKGPTRPVTPAERREALKFARPAFANLAAQALIMNSDVLLVRAFLPTREAGIYAAVSIIGRVVFYGAWAVSTAIFPLVAARRSGNAGQLLWLSLGLTGLVSGGVTVVCALAPALIVNLLFGAAYLPGASILAPYALITTLYALSNAVINHTLALDRSRNAYLIAVIAVFQVTLMLFNHATVQAILLDQLIGQSLLLLISLLMLRTPKPVLPEKSYVLH
jgi:O-antigen/teichoic acid export membrane protein